MGLFEDLAEITRPLAVAEVRHKHGLKYNDCELCDSEIIEGKEVRIEHNQLKINETIIYKQGEVVSHQMSSKDFRNLHR